MDGLLSEVKLPLSKTSKLLFWLAALAMLGIALWPQIKVYIEQYRANFPPVADGDFEREQDGDGDGDGQNGPQFTTVETV
jgi:hypothetical protein